MRKIVRLFTKGAIIEMQSLDEFLRTACGDQTFKEGYEKTGLIINIVVAGDHHEEYKVLNHMTAPNVLIWSASLASCSVPGLYTPTKIMCKDRYGKIREWFPICTIFLRQPRSSWMELSAETFPKGRWQSSSMRTTS